MMVHTSSALKDLYLLLAMGFAQPSDQLVEGMVDGAFQADVVECLRELGDIAGADEVAMLTEHLIGGADDLATHLRAEHFRLFVGSRNAAVTPYESMLRAEIRGETGMVMLAGSALDAGKAYERFGVAARGQEPPDNIAYQLEFIALLLEEIDAGNKLATREYNRYVKAHFTDWIDYFIRRVGEEARDSFYAAMARALDTAVQSARSSVS